MATFEIRGLDEYERKISRLSRDIKKQVIAPAIYDGADIVADEIRSEIERLPIDGGYAASGRLLQGINAVQRDALLDSLGITRLRDDDGFVNVKIGFTGYNSIKTKRWPHGQPNDMIARSLEKGTSFLKKNAFRLRAINRAKSRVISIMTTVVDRKIYDLMRK